MTTDSEVYDNRNLFFFSSGAQKCEIKLSSEGSRGESFLASFSFGQLQAFLSVGQLHSSLCLCLLTALPTYLSSFLSLVRTLVIAKVCLNTERSYSQIFYLITSVMTLFPNKVTLRFSGSQSSGGHYSTHCVRVVRTMETRALGYAFSLSAPESVVVYVWLPLGLPSPVQRKEKEEMELVLYVDGETRLKL